MNLSPITPYIAVATPVFALGPILDFVLKDEVKHRFADKVFRLANIGTRPRTLSFYGLIVLASILFTSIIILENGSLRTIKESERSFALALKSAGPLFLAVFGKILFFDYAMAVKSSVLFDSMQQSIPIKPGLNNRRAWLLVCLKIIVAVVDLLITAAFTAWLMNWFDAIQMHGISSMSTPTKPTVTSIADFFDEINFMLNESIMKSFYFLNGSLFFYSAKGISSLARGALPHIDATRAKDNIFKCMGALASAVLVIVLITYNIVEH